MINKIIAISDLHIPSYRRLEEYQEQLIKLIYSVKNNVLDKDSTRIILLGDIFHNKNFVTNESITITSNLIRELSQIATVYVICGNHDLVLHNQNRMDSLTALFNTAQFDNATFLDKELNYDSGIIEDDNIIWALWSIYNDYSPINIKDINTDGKKIIGLIHGTIVGCSLSNGYNSENGIDGNMFNGCNLVLAGDIHKRQILKRSGVEIIYPSSFIQQNFGETISCHGYCIVNIDEKGDISYEFVDIESDYGLYDIQIHSIEDIDNDKEQLINI